MKSKELLAQGILPHTVANLERPYQLKEKGRVWDLIGCRHNTWQAIYPFIYAPPESVQREQRTQTGQATNPFHEAIYVHEAIHVKRQENTGVGLWYLRYLLDQKFRLEEELVAIQAQMQVLALAGTLFPLESMARSLSSWLYLHMIDVEESRAILQKMWADTRRAYHSNTPN